ncbi:putative glyoxalase superfamily metalloenzyme YdcJ [Rhodococcus sp. 27YEA15]|uniref:2-oxoadipate dioxygenase/decarboxylase n=1 Tax=Rhodococcus sp. 27YEA15 TaxID=3156259 RepID=UPI003C7EC586
MVETCELRSRFAATLAFMYGREVPAYTTLTEVTQDVNRRHADRYPDIAERLGSLERVGAERHCAVRLGSLDELREVAVVFAGLGMSAVGYYDLRQTDSPIPVVSTAFRPVDPEELERNPFRVFTSVLTVGDSRFFDNDLRRRVATYVARRRLFSPDLLRWARRASADGGLPESEAGLFVDAATDVFRLGTEPIDAAWYRELAAVSPVAADIAGQASTHVNHLTPRVLDIDELYRRMTDRGVTMIDRIQGPPKRTGTPLLLRQTSFRALNEARRFRHADGTITREHVRVRFGEVESRGIALTRAGRDIYDRLIGEPDSARWEEAFPHTEQGLDEAGLAYFTYRRDGERTVRMPIVYEDFLPASAAGIFASNLDAVPGFVPAAPGAQYGQDQLEGAIERPVHDPFELYRAQQDSSLARLNRACHDERPLP